MATPTYTKTGNKATTAAKLHKAVFGLNVTSHALVKQAYVTYQANSRENLAKTLKRGEVRGGGKKPWKQKGTGRARFGSIRVPIWRGGGITFGPLGNENYSKSLNKKAKRQAIRQALSMNSENVIVADTPEFKGGKTAEAKAFFDKIGATRNTLFVVEDKSEQLMRATNNLPNVSVVSAMYVNVYDVMNAHSIVITPKALEIIETWLGTQPTDTAKAADTKPAKLAEAKK